MTINIFIQARMSSKRFPGKILAPFKGRPIIFHLIKAAQAVSLVQKVVVLTSEHESDDPLASYLNYLSIPHFRGDLDNVFQRFQDALIQFPCDKFIRLCADSPLMEPDLIQKVIELSCDVADITTNVHTRTFPKGLSVEVIKSETFSNINLNEVDVEGKEHITAHFYKNPQKYKIKSVISSQDYQQENFCIDEINDMERLTLRGESYIFNPDKISARMI
ncbi:MAG: hypothetical protein FJX03_00630 [Alphaproteobacteria bacterium]|nr:hypothetical protein [Alphaproteobacteria bacterium]